ncbi:hypothetical protein SLEP1_g25596 [Rubroshorea leprosula]|uniref:Uncharacterized protein n=1 Tax=Rubroshorea leprosula TaxID=152421 RepID=A0AAV5JQR4_9ROSI|nr:hypothetical protein SLEP1_g25596 [Rubroshorea leprosula]
MHDWNESGDFIVFLELSMIGMKMRISLFFWSRACLFGID